MKNFLLIIAWMAMGINACGQNNKRSSDLFSEAKEILSNGTNVSIVLTNERYLSLHPDTEFRELIKEHATASILKITPPGEPGQLIKVKGVVQDASGSPVAGALVYLYQTDSKGWYAADRPHVGGNGGDVGHARLFGYVKTDANGKFELHTIKPSGYPQSDLPAHIHVHAWAAGFNNFVNEFLFDDDDRLVGNIREQAIRNQFIISKPEKSTGSFEQEFSYTVRLRK